MTDGFRLVMTQGPEPGQTFALENEATVIGRDPASDVVIDHPQVSRQHARLTRQGPVIVLEDLQSTNGTFVNGMQLMAPHTLASGDVISLGDAVTFTFYGPAPRPAPTVMTQPKTARTPTPPPRGPQPAPPAYAPPSAPEYDAPPKRRRTWLWVGCGCGALLALVALAAAVYLMDLYFPNILYAPLRWLGF